MIKLIIFDLDGVLVDSCDTHFVAFNLALERSGLSKISYEDHLKTFNGIPTIKKLHLLKDKVPESMWTTIIANKQKFTIDIMNRYDPDPRLCEVLAKLKRDNLTVYCASNSIWKTVKTVLLRRGFMEYMDYFITNEDVCYSKPHPEMYLKCFERAQVLPSEVVIVEDSAVGIEAAEASGAYVLNVKDSQDVTYDKIQQMCVEIEQKKRRDKLKEC
jgi:HAD superfamily hydrolase (TIGR01509 family)